MDRRVRIDTRPPAELDWAVVVVDVIRSTTTATTALALGRRCFPAGSLEAARAAACRLCDALLVGELGGQPPAGFHLTNSPAKLAERTDVWRPIVLLSSSGMPLLAEADGHSAVHVACLRNHFAAAAHLAAAGHERIAVLGAPTHGELREEDQLCCAYVAEHLVRAGYRPDDELTERLLERWAGAPPDAFLGSRSVAYLRASGQLCDLEFILQHVDDLNTAFTLRGGELVAAELE